MDEPFPPDLIRRFEKRYNRTGMAGVLTSAADSILRNFFSHDNFYSNSNLKNSIKYRNDVRQKGQTEFYSSHEKIKIDGSEQRLPPELSAQTGEYMLEKPFFTEIEDGTVVGSKGIVLDSSKDIILESIDGKEWLLYENFSKKPVDFLSYMSSDYLPSAPNELKIIPLLDYYNSYHSWVYHQLPRLQGVKEYLDDNYKILIRSDPPDWMQESLYLLGFSSQDLVEWDSRIQEFNKICIPSMRTIETKRAQKIDEKSNQRYTLYSKIASKKGFNWLRGELMSNIAKNKEFSQRVIISREDVNTRTIQNKNQAYHWLYDHGFVEYTLSDLSFEDQVSLFSNAEYIVSPHGAGLTNIVFAKECTVCEILGTNIRKPTYYILSEIMGHQYQFIVGTQQTNHRDEDIVVDAGGLKDLIQDEL